MEAQSQVLTQCNIHLRELMGKIEEVAACRREKRFYLMAEIEKEVTIYRTKVQELIVNWFELGFFPHGVPDYVIVGFDMSKSDFETKNQHQTELVH